MSNLHSMGRGQALSPKEQGSSSGSGQRLVYISPFKQAKLEEQRPQAQFIKIDANPPQSLPPKATPFRRSSRNSSKDHSAHTREKSGELKSFRNLNESLEKEGRGRIASLEKQLRQERADGERWRGLCSSQQEKIKALMQELGKSREERQALHGELLALRGQLEQSQRTGSRQAEQIDALSKSLKESKISQKSLANLKQLQNQIDLLQSKNTVLCKEIDQLNKSNKKMKGELFKKKECISESQLESKKEEKIRSLEMEVKRMKQELAKDRSQRELLLENNLHSLERKLYEKENEIKRISIQLNCLDRKKYISIDEVKAKKDQEIKDLRQKFNKVNRDLKETRNKIEQNQYRRAPKSPFVRKIKSSQLLGTTSESEEVTFEFSSEA